MENSLELEVLHVVSHEAKTYVSNISGVAQTLSRFYERGELDKCDVEKNLSMILANCTKIQRLMNNIVDLSAENTAAMMLDAVYVDMVAFCDSLCELSEAEMGGAAEITFKTDCDSLYVYCDILKMERVLLNLISNSVKYTRNACRILIELGGNDDEWWFCVSDNGIGISEDMREKVFLPFVRHIAENVPTRNGTGLGLAIVDKFIRIHSGEVKIKDSELGGCRFDIHIPRNNGNMIKLKEVSTAPKPSQDAVKQELDI